MAETWLCWAADESTDEDEIEAYDAEDAARKYIEELDHDSADVTKEAFVWVVADGEDRSKAELFLVASEPTIEYTAWSAEMHTCATCQKTEGCTSKHAEGRPHECDNCASKRRYLAWQETLKGVRGG